MSKKPQIVMSRISENVKWHDDREQIVRYADETLAMSHPKVKERIKELREENYKLKKGMGKQVTKSEQTFMDIVYGIVLVSAMVALVMFVAAVIYEVGQK